MATLNNDGSVSCDGVAASAATRDNLESALKSVDNLTKLLTLLGEQKKSRSAAINVSFNKGVISVYVTADDRVDEVQLAKTFLAAFNALLENHGEKVSP